MTEKSSLDLEVYYSLGGFVYPALAYLSRLYLFLDNIYVFIDLDELGPGTYELPLTIETTGNSYVSYELLQKTVNITISSTED